MNRGLLLLVVFASSVAVAPSQVSQPDFRLQVVPAIVYKVDDPGGARTSSFVFNAAVICSTDCELTPISARVELFSAGSIVERQDWATEMLAQIKRISYRVEPNTPLASPTRAFTLPEAFDVRFYFRHPQALAIDSAVVRMTVADVKGRRAEQTLRIPIRYYQQKTALTLPFRGKGVVGQDWITNGGHGGVWNAFAVDMRGLDSNYAAQLNDANENASDAGWNREILAPAAGTVIYARNDVPTNPRPGEQPDVNSWYLPLPDPVMAYAGNCAIIDHGNSEVQRHDAPATGLCHRQSRGSGPHGPSSWTVGELGRRIRTTLALPTSVRPKAVSGPVVAVQVSKRRSSALPRQAVRCEIDWRSPDSTEIRDLTRAVRRTSWSHQRHQSRVNTRARSIRMAPHAGIAAAAPDTSTRTIAGTAKLVGSPGETPIRSPAIARPLNRATSKPSARPISPGINVHLIR